METGREKGTSDAALNTRQAGWERVKWTLAPDGDVLSLLPLTSVNGIQAELTMGLKLCGLDYL
ncbi:MAG: hypothetical protein RI575_16675 [Balneolaceae bacterium]|nr:hypothetical protein [Balneolaceae bacterium]MDR9410437.1 hypothetical protein [Balneolaceae bacterium]